MSDFPAIDENQIQPMDAKRRGERFTYDTDKPYHEQSDKRFNITTGFTTVVEKPSYGLVREGNYLENPAN